MFELLLKNNMVIVFLICIYYILMGIQLKNINKQIILCYLLIMITRYLNIIDLKIALPIFVVTTFIYFEFLIEDNFKIKIFSNFFYKIVDYLFLMIFKYKLLLFILIIYFMSHMYQQTITNYPTLITICWIVEIVLFFYLISKITQNEFDIHTYDEIYKDNFFDKRIDSIEKIDNDLEEILLYYEDRSYYIREKQYTLACIPYIKYKYELANTSYYIKKVKRYKINIIFYFIKITIFKIFHIVGRVFGYFFLRKPLRGFSTIEMQLLRTIAISDGYEKKAKTRKIYEFIYTPIFFRGLKKYLQGNYKTVSSRLYKQYLLNIYLEKAPVFYKKRYKNIGCLFGCNNIKEVNKNQFLLGVLALSNKLNENNIISGSKKFNLDLEEVMKEFKKLS